MAEEKMHVVVTQLLTSLYVDELEDSVTEEELRQLFAQSGGDLLSVKICNDDITFRKYAYVNYGNPQDAEKALEVLNFTRLKGRFIRIAYSSKDGALRKSSQANIFIKNLDKDIDHKRLHEMFSSFGKILSCKVEPDSSGISKGYGFVQYKDEETASKAIEHMHGVVLSGKELHVVPFLSKDERDLSVDTTKFTNVYVKNLSESTTEEDLKCIFGEFGATTSIAVMRNAEVRNAEGHSKCFGFINFENADDAARSVEILHGRRHNGKEWYVGRALKKSERVVEIKKEREQMAKDVLHMTNLYISNIDTAVDSAKLNQLFSPFGVIKLCKVMTNSKGLSKGYGFVAFSTAQEASRAIALMHWRIVGNKPLYVSIADMKEFRGQQQLQIPSVVPTMVMPPHSYFPMHPPYGQPIIFNHAAMLPNMATLVHQQQQFGFRPCLMVPMIPQVCPPLPAMHRQMPSRMRRSYGRFRSLDAHSEASTSTAPAHRPTLASALANASPHEQRNMLGSYLFPLVEQVEPKMAVKVTGKLLEMDQSEVLHLLESPEALIAKIEEAKDVLMQPPSH